MCFVCKSYLKELSIYWVISRFHPLLKQNLLRRCVSREVQFSLENSFTILRLAQLEELFIAHRVQLGF